MQSEPDEKMQKNAEKCRKKCCLNLWDLEKLGVCPITGQGMGNKAENKSPNYSHMKIGPNDILGEHFDFFFFFCHLYELRS